MRELRWVSAVVAATWLSPCASAQQGVAGAIPAPASALAPALSDSAAPEATIADDPTDGVNWRDRVAAAQRRHAEWVACVAAKRPDCEEAPAAPDPMDALLNDDTLVNGDVVSTATGFKVFRGQSSAPHSLADFQ
jgi:hypothetical protein